MATQNLFATEITEPSQPQTGKTAWAHCDGGARGNPGPAGYGAVIADEFGATLAELSEYLGKRTNNYAEYSGLLGVLQWALNHSVAHLRVVSDSELMVKQVQGRYKVNSPDLRPLFEEAKRRIARLESFEITHALRHKNKDADRLANEAMDRGMGRSPEKSAAAAVVPTPESRTDSYAERRTSTGLSVSGDTTLPGATMLRAFVRDGVIHLLGGKTLPEGSFVKVIAE